MTSPRTRYDAVLHAAREVTGVGTALEAEMLGAALLGSVYAVADPPRGAGLREFVGGFLAGTSRRRTAAAYTIRRVFAALVPDADGAATVRPGREPPPWADQLGRVRPVETWAYGDVYGDQTGYLASFTYDAPEVGGGEHAMVALVDHNIGIVKDLFVTTPADRVLSQVRTAAEADEFVWCSRMDPGTLRARVDHHLEITDALSALPEGGAVATDRALVGARLAALPAAPPEALPVDPAVDPRRLADEFLASPEFGASPGAAVLDRDGDSPEAAAIRYAVRLILDFGQDAPDRDPLRWSPAVVGLFLLDWVHRRAVLDDADVAALPPVLHAWVAWAARRRGLPTAPAGATEETVDTMAEELTRLHRSGERRGPAVTTAARLLADGVDPRDEGAVSDWLERQPGDPSTAEIPHPR